MFKKIVKYETNGRIDKLLLIWIIALAVYGTLMVFSAGTAYASARYGDALYFVKKQTVWLVIGLAVMSLCSRIKTSVYKRSSLYLYIGTVFMLVLVLIIGFAGNGAQRWISIGPLTVQPSEIGKLSLIMMLAKYFSDNAERATERNGGSVSFLYGTLYPALIMLLPILLVMLQKHLSCIIILGSIGLILIFCAGVNPKYISFFCGIGVGAVSFLAFFTDYTKDRITVWRDPEAYKLTGGWQTLQGLMAIGSGGLFGVGFGNSILKHCYVSEPANDMIFAILCEELGFVGAALAILLFALLVQRACHIAMRTQDTYSRLVALGIGIKTAIQALLNVAVVTNTIPNTGISLPFFSYGGSSLVMLFFEMGILLSVSREAGISK